MAHCRHLMSLEALLSEIEATHSELQRRLIGLHEKDLRALESRAGIELPRCLRATIARVGLLTNPFSMHSRLADWVSANEGMRERISEAFEADLIEPETEIARILAN